MRKPKQAHQISVGRCDCGCGEFHLYLYDDRGRVFATASLPPETALRISDDIFEELCPDIGDDDDEIGEVAGNA